MAAVSIVHSIITHITFIEWHTCSTIPLALYLELFSGFHKGIMVKFKHSLYLSLSVPEDMILLNV